MKDHPIATLCYYLVAAKAIYEREGTVRQRSLNVLVESVTPHITRKGLSAINQSVFRRVEAENAVTADQVKDIVILNIVPLGMMTPEEFHGPAMETSEEAEVAQEATP